MKPLLGLAFCCTSVPAPLREDLAHKLASMGGVHYNDLMSDVNYLIVGDRKTDKYNYCVRHRHDVKFIRAEAVVKVYNLWLSGEESRDILDLNNYLLPVFDGLVVCMSRISFSDKRLHERLFDQNFRQRHTPMGHLEIYEAHKLAKYIEANGGKVTDLLTVSNSCVVTTENRGKRYLKALEWHIAVVHPIWVYDLMLRQAALNLEDYHIDRQGDDSKFAKGCNVWDTVLKPSSKEEATDTFAAGSADFVPAALSLAKHVPLNRTPAVWNSIMAPGNISGKSQHQDLWDEIEDETKGKEAEEAKQTSNTDAVPPSQPSSLKVLGGCAFGFVGFARNQVVVLTKVIESNGGEVVQDIADTSITHVITPSQRGFELTKLLRSLPATTNDRITNSKVQVVTEWFIERSIFYEKYTLDQWGKPLRAASLSTPMATLLQVCITGFTGIELLHLQKLISYLGFQYCDSLTLTRDLMVVNVSLFKDILAKKSPQLLDYKFKDIINCPVYLGSVSLILSKNKINAAKNWGVPIVSIAFIWEILDQSSGKTSLQMPDIMDTRWCIFVPMGYKKTTTLIDFIKNIEIDQASNTRIEQQGETAAAASPPHNISPLPQLPSPRKGSTQKFGRIVGRLPQKMTNSLPSRDSSQGITLEEENIGVGYATESVELPKQKRRKLTK